MIDWIICVLTQTDNVKYITSDNEYSEYKRYDSFIEYIITLDILNFLEFKKYLNTYKYLYIDLSTKEWFIYDHVEDLPKFSNQDLVQYNEKLRENEDKKETDSNFKFKIFINKKVNKVKDKFQNKTKTSFDAYNRER